MVSAGSGPAASIPSARRAATAGAITSRPPVPRAPFSPACGLSPASARRGAAMPKRVLQVARDDPGRLHDQLRREGCGNRGQGDVHRHRHHRQRPRSRASSPDAAVSVAGRLQARPGIPCGRDARKPALVEHVLRDRVGHERRRLALRATSRTAVSIDSMSLGVAGIGSPGRGATPVGEGKDRQGPSEDASRRPRTARRDGTFQPSDAGDAAQVGGIGKDGEGRQSRLRAAAPGPRVSSGPIPAGSPWVRSAGELARTRHSAVTPRGRRRSRRCSG